VEPQFVAIVQKRSVRQMDKIKLGYAINRISRIYASITSLMQFAMADRYCYWLIVFSSDCGGYDEDLRAYKNDMKQEATNRVTKGK